MLPFMAIAVGVQLLAAVTLGISLVVSFREPVQLTFPGVFDTTVHFQLEDGRVALGTWWLEPEELWDHLDAWRNGRVKWASPVTEAAGIQLWGCGVMWMFFQDNSTDFGVMLSFPIAVLLLMGSSLASIWLLRRWTRSLKTDRSESGLH